MSLQLTFNGGEVIMRRDLGSPNSVQGFITDQITLGANDTQLQTEFLFQSTESVQLSLLELLNTIVWLKVSGVWKQTTPFIKISGVWKEATPFIKIGGSWR